MSKFEKEMLESLSEMEAFARGELAVAHVFVPIDINVAAIRKKLGLTQAKFAARFGLNPTSVRDWEQQHRRPDAAARVLLRVIEREPEAVARALSAA